MVDLDGLASGILLRDIHTGLLKLVEGKGSNAEPPVKAKLVVGGYAHLCYAKKSILIQHITIPTVD